jgi:AP-1 complex subunit sigma 1/2
MVVLFLRYFGNVCELDIIFNFHKAYYLLDELIINGEFQEPSKRHVLKAVLAQDALQAEMDGKDSVNRDLLEIKPK